MPPTGATQTSCTQPQGLDLKRQQEEAKQRRQAVDQLLARVTSQQKQEQERQQRRKQLLAARLEREAKGIVLPEVLLVAGPGKGFLLHTGCVDYNRATATRQDTSTIHVN